MCFAAFGSLPTRAAPACQLAEVFSLPITFERGLLLVPAKIAGQPVRLALATGMKISAVTQDFARKHDFLRIHDHFDAPLAQGLVAWGGGFETVLATDLELGTAKVKQFEAIGLGPYTNRSGVAYGSADGLLGADILANFDIEINLRTKKVAFLSPNHCSENFLDWTEPYVEGTFKSHPSDLPNDEDLPMASLTLNDFPLDGVIATEHVRSQLISIHPNQFNITDKTPWADVALGGSISKSTPILFSDTQHFFYDDWLVVGNDLLMGRGLYISFKLKKVYLTQKKES